ncbi:MAG: serine/threonine protein kinase [Phycisphaerales bacterium]|nr:serine/threonine protein kinase [Phycisphaerales bacterium]
MAKPLLDAGSQGADAQALVDYACRQTASAVKAAPLERAALPAAGSIPGYELVEEIRRGGQGVVYRAIQKSTGKPVAIKVLRDRLVVRPKERARFEREADILVALDHPNIVGIGNRGSFGGHFFIVMDFIEGQPLDEFVRRMQPTLQVSLRLFARICDAIQTAHSCKIVHRDLKPSNILVDDRGEPRVLDFGLAKLGSDSALRDGDMSLTLTGEFYGSLPWAAPEQVEGANDRIDARTDVHALGLILFHMLTGRFPYSVVGPKRMVLNTIVQAEPTRLGTICQDIDDDVNTIVQKCLQKDPERRYRDVAALQEDVRRYLANEPICARRPTAVYRFRKFARRNKAAVAGVGGVFVALIAGATVSVGFAIRESEQRHLAEQRLEQTEDARAETELRRNEAEQVAAFQATQLADIDTELMGVRLRARVIAERRSALEARGSERSVVAAEMREFETSLSGVNFTVVALEMLDENIFDRALAAIEGQFADQPLVKARLLQAIADTLRDLGLLDSAATPQKEALHIRREQLGDDDPDTLSSFNSMGQVLRDRGDLASAEQHFRKAMDARLQQFGRDDCRTLSSINNMGALLQAQSRLAEAEAYFRQAFEGRLRVLGTGHYDTLQSATNLVGLLKERGETTEATVISQMAVTWLKTLPRDDHPKSIQSMSNIASLLRSLGMPMDAEPLYRQVLDRRRRVLGDDHPDTLQSIANVGRVLLMQEKFAEADSFLFEALERRRRTLGSDHPDTLSTIEAIGDLFSAQGRLFEAESYLCEALAARRRTQGNDHRVTLLLLHKLGSLFEAEGKLVEAEDCYREAFEGLHRLLGHDHPDTLASIHALGQLLVDGNQH